MHSENINMIHIDQSLAMEWVLTTGMFEKSEDVVDLLKFSEDCTKVFTAMPEISEGESRKIYVEEFGFCSSLAMTVSTAHWFICLFKEHYFPCQEDMLNQLNQIEREEYEQA